VLLLLLLLLGVRPPVFIGVTPVDDVAAASIRSSARDGGLIRATSGLYADVPLVQLDEDKDDAAVDGALTFTRICGGR
jgi:hypothetical protein